MVAGVFVERHRSREHAATRVRDMHHLEESLQQTVLTRSAVDGYVGVIELGYFVQRLEVCTLQFNDLCVITFGV